MKLKKVLASLAVASMLFACGGGDGDNKGSGTTEPETSAKYAKVGFAIDVHDIGEKGQVNTYMAVVGLDENDVVKYVKIDVAQQTPSKEDESLKTKKEKKEEYGMVGQSNIGKEWYEQAEALEAYMIDKTAEEIKNIDTYEKDENHLAVPATDGDLASSVTISIDGYQDIVIKAIENAKAFDGIEKIGLGHDISIDVEKNQVNTTAAAVAVDADGKVIWAYLDTAQNKGEADADTRTKKDKGPDYNMVGSSDIGKEWFEQAEALEAHVVGMTSADIQGIEVYQKDDSHTAVPVEGSDLASSVSITIGAYQAALVEAIANAG